jgi:hypothetical protein
MTIFKQIFMGAPIAIGAGAMIVLSACGRATEHVDELLPEDLMEPWSED